MLIEVTFDAAVMLASPLVRAHVMPHTCICFLGCCLLSFLPIQLALSSTYIPKYFSSLLTYKHESQHVLAILVFYSFFYFFIIVIF